MSLAVKFYKDQEACHFVGSGFAIAPGWILTCKHVLVGCGESIWMKPSDQDPVERITQQWIPVHIAGGRPNDDLALVCCASVFDSISKLGVGLEKEFWNDLVRQDCHVIGGSHGDRKSINHTIQVTSTSMNMPTEVQVHGGLVEGFSGSPVVLEPNRDPIVIGIAYHGGHGVSHSRLFLIDPVVDFIRRGTVQGLSVNDLKVVDLQHRKKDQFVEIRNLIEKRRFEDAVKAMRKICEGHADKFVAHKTDSSLTTIAGQIYQINEDEIDGVVAHDVLDARKSRISRQLLGLFRDLIPIVPPTRPSLPSPVNLPTQAKASGVTNVKVTISGSNSRDVKAVGRLQTGSSGAASSGQDANVSVDVTESTVGDVIAFGEVRVSDQHATEFVRNLGKMPEPPETQ